MYFLIFIALCGMLKPQTMYMTILLNNSYHNMLKVCEMFPVGGMLKIHAIHRYFANSYHNIQDAGEICECEDVKIFPWLAELFENFRVLFLEPKFLCPIS